MAYRCGVTESLLENRIQVVKWWRVLVLDQTNIWRIDLVCGHSFYLVLAKGQFPMDYIECWRCEHGLPSMGTPFPHSQRNLYRW